MPFGEHISYADTRTATKPQTTTLNRDTRLLLQEIHDALQSNIKMAEVHGLDQVRLSVPRARDIVNNIKSLLK